MAVTDYNPASLRVKEATSGKDIPGIVTVVFPDGWVTDKGRGVAQIAGVPAAATGLLLIAFEPTQDVTDPRKFTIPGSDSWAPSSIRVYLNGQRLRTSLLSISGTGNRTIILAPTVPAPNLAAGDIVEGEGAKQ